MSNSPATVERRIVLTPDRAARLDDLALTQGVSEDVVIQKALDILFSLTEPFDHHAELWAWLKLAETSAARVWDNPDDARYDNWRELYGVPD